MRLHTVEAAENPDGASKGNLPERSEGFGCKITPEFLFALIAMQKNRPKYLNLFRIKLPLPGFVSILHRASGLLLFLALPVLLWMLQASLLSIETFTGLQGYLDHPLLKLPLIGLLWALMHHFFAGLRYLLIDLHWLPGLKGARHSAVWVLLLSLSLTLLLGVKLW